MLLKEISIINPKPDHKKFNFINYIDTSSVNDGTLFNVLHLVKNYPSRAKRELRNNDILISSVRPNFKHNYYVRNNLPNLVASTGFHHIRITNTNFSSKYLFYFLTSSKQISYYTSIANFSQTTFPTFNKDVLENIEIPDISYEEQQHIVGAIHSFHFLF